MSAVSFVASVSRPRCCANSSRSSVWASAFFESTRLLVTSEMSDGSRCTCKRLREAVHQAGELHPRVVESADELVELLLRGDDEPHLPAPDATEALHDRLEVEHLLHVARDELPDLVDDEDERLARLPPVHQLFAALGEEARRDVRPVLDGVAPAVGGDERLRVELVHHAARLLHGDRDQALLGVPVLLVDLGVLRLERVEPALLLERDLELREVEITGVAEALKERAGT